MRSSTAFALLTLSTLLPACGDDVALTDPAHFAAASSSVRTWSVNAALGHNVDFAFETLNSWVLYHRADPTCPTRTIQGRTVVFSADGCLSDGGYTLSGQIEITNGGYGAEVDEAAPLEARFTDTRMVAGSTLREVDGTFSQTSPDGKGRFRLVAELNAGAGEQTIVSYALTCARAGDDYHCATEAGAFGEVAGLGHFDFAFDMKVEGEVSSGWIELTGAQVLRVDDLGSTCTMTIDGKATGAYCDATTPLIVVRRTTL